MKIKNYYTEGEAVDQDWIVAHREEIEFYMRQDMRDHGWAPVMDSSSTLQWEWDHERGLVKFKMGIKGAYIGKKAKKMLGIVDGMLVMEKDEEVSFELA